MRTKIFLLAILFYACEKQVPQPVQSPAHSKAASNTDTLYTYSSVWIDDTLGLGRDTSIHLNPPYYWNNNLSQDTLNKYGLNYQPEWISTVVWIRTSSSSAWVKLPTANFFTTGDSIGIYRGSIPSSTIWYRYGRLVMIPHPVDIKEAITHK